MLIIFLKGNMNLHHSMRNIIVNLFQWSYPGTQADRQCRRSCNMVYSQIIARVWQRHRPFNTPFTYFVCINSWGSFDPHTNIKFDQEGNRIFKMNASFTRLKCDDSDSEGSVYIETIENIDRLQHSFLCMFLITLIICWKGHKSLRSPIELRWTANHWRK